VLLHRFDTAVTSEHDDLLVQTGVAVGRAGRYLDSGPVYVMWPTALGLLLLWTVVPVAVGYYRFGTADL